MLLSLLVSFFGLTIDASVNSVGCMHYSLWVLFSVKQEKKLTPFSFQSLVLCSSEIRNIPISAKKFGKNRTLLCFLINAESLIVIFL